LPKGLRLFRKVNRYVGNLAPMPGLFPDYPAPVIRNASDGWELAMMRWGMPPPPRTGGLPVTNIRNTSSPHWRGWLKPENRCLVPLNSFAEYAPARHGGATRPYATAAPARTDSGRDHRVGWVVGVGWEYAFNNNWSAKAEYLHMDFGSQSVLAFQNVPAPVFAINHTFNFREDVVRVGLNYRFGGAGPVVARY
jgi:hypothetical protein